MKKCVCILVAAFASGCVPAQTVTRIGARGVVVDASTRRPISQAVINVDGALLQGATTASGDDGKFLVPAFTRTSLVRIRRNWPETRSVLTVARAGYSPYRLELRTRPVLTEAGTVLNVGTVALAPTRR